jgi:hypothetical protein
MNRSADDLASGMPAMLTGLEYRNERPAPEFVRDAFKRASILDKVSRAGYDVDAMSIVPVESFEEWLGPESAPNWKGARFRIRKPFISQGDYRAVAARELAELSLFRHVPHRLKEAASRIPTRFTVRSGWIAAIHLPRSEDTKRAIRWRSSSTSPHGWTWEAIGRSTSCSTWACRIARSWSTATAASSGSRTCRASRTSSNRDAR